MTDQLSVRDRSEVVRSASEAAKIVVKAAEINRYLNPSADTVYPLEYAFYLLGETRGKTVLDLGCGAGEELMPLLGRGANVIGIDISPELIDIAKRRLNDAQLSATVRVGSAYETGLPDGSVDIIFCMSLIHHLNIPRVKKEMQRVLRPGGFIVLKEPIRFSKVYAFLRSLLPAHEDISEYEHPLTQDELQTFQDGFVVDGLRLFRLPIVPVAQRLFPSLERNFFRLSNWALKKFPVTAHYATVAVLRLQ
jgi:SAM-dependent methyltransferase